MPTSRMTSTPERPSQPAATASAPANGAAPGIASASSGRTRITAISLFAGCGGMDLGFQGGFDFMGQSYGPTGIQVVWANELSRYACRTYRLNLGDHIIEGDIKDHMDAMPSSADIVVGGFPCQDISINGKMRGVDGERSSLYTYICQAVEKVRPKAFVAENVGGLLLKQNRHSLDRITEDFDALGYQVTCHLYHAEQYGVPQTRERVMFVGTRSDLPPFAPPAPATPGHPITAYEALHDLEDHPQDKPFSHIWSAAKPSAEQGNRHLVADRPGYTIRAECHGNIQFHYSLPRRISMREAARIQSFPDSFIFPCGLRETERQIGNAVPPVLAWHIANAVKSALQG